MTENHREMSWELAETSRMLRRGFDRRAASLGTTSAQWRVMFRLGREPGLKQVELAERLDVEPITAGRIIDRLQESGLVERRPDPVDRRAWRLFLTSRAASVIERLKLVAEDILSAALEGVSPEELAAFRSTLGRIRANMSLIEGLERKSA